MLTPSESGGFGVCLHVRVYVMCVGIGETNLPRMAVSSLGHAVRNWALTSLDLELHYILFFLFLKVDIQNSAS